MEFGKGKRGLAINMTGWIRLSRIIIIIIIIHHYHHRVPYPMTDVAIPTHRNLLI